MVFFILKVCRFLSNPNPAETLDVYNGIGDYLKEFDPMKGNEKVSLVLG